MNQVEKVKAICKERKIPISKLEKECGFCNGYIGQLKKGVFPANRFAKIANYLNISADDLDSSYLEVNMIDEEVKEALRGANRDRLIAYAKNLNELNYQDKKKSNKED